MAKIKNQVISGKLGDVIYKSWKGKPYVIAAYDRKESQSEAYCESKRQFSVCCKLGASMSRIKVLRDHWDKTAVEADNARNKFSKVNRPLLLPEDDISKVRLVSDIDLHPVILREYDLRENELSCVFNVSPLNHLWKEISLQGIVLLLDPKEPVDKEIKSFPFVSENYDLVNGDEISLSARFTSQDSELLKRYSNKKILLNLAFKNLQGGAEKFSETFCKE